MSTTGDLVARLRLCALSLSLILLAAPVWAQDWSPYVVVGASEGSYADADGTLVCFVTGTIGYARQVGCSDDEGTTWRPMVTLAGSQMPILEKSIAVRGNVVAVLRYAANWTITDWCCTRPVGPVYLDVSTDRGKTFTGPVLLSSPTAYALRISLAVSGTTVHVDWMEWRNAPMALGKGTWDIKYRRWSNGVLGPITTLAVGTTDVGAERPAIAAFGNVVQAVYMDGRDNLASCAIEGGTVLPQCTEIYGRRSLDGGTTWEAERRLTFDVPYSGRPTLSTDGVTWLVTYDHRVAGQNNDAAVLRSTDNGANWTQGAITTGGSGVSHTSTVINGTDAVALWIGLDASLSFDGGVTWSTPERLSPGSNVPSAAMSANYFHAIYGYGYPTQLRYRRKPRTGTPPPPPPPPPCTAGATGDVVVSGQLYRVTVTEMCDPSVVGPL